MNCNEFILKMDQHEDLLQSNNLRCLPRRNNLAQNSCRQIICNKVFAQLVNDWLLFFLNHAKTEMLTIHLIGASSVF